MFVTPQLAGQQDATPLDLHSVADGVLTSPHLRWPALWLCAVPCMHNTFHVGSRRFLNTSTSGWAGFRLPLQGLGDTSWNPTPPRHFQVISGTRERLTLLPRFSQTLSSRGHRGIRHHYHPCQPQQPSSLCSRINSPTTRCCTSVDGMQEQHLPASTTCTPMNIGDFQSPPTQTNHISPRSCMTHLQLYAGTIRHP